MFVCLDGPITLMAPTDDAFNRLGNETVAKLLQNPTLLGGKFTTQMPLSIAGELSSSSSSFSCDKDIFANNVVFSSDVLKYHILHGTLYSRGMHSGSFHTLEETDRLRIYESFFGLFNLRFTFDIEKKTPRKNNILTE